jgi:2-C-methyl-D-erythritol 4-phosphate cytidylyltransferase
MKFVIVTAGGKGIRLGSGVSKQLVLLKGRTLLEWALRPFREEGFEGVIVVYPSDEDQSVYGKILEQAGFREGNLVKGGVTRFESVRNGFESIQAAHGTDPVLIHDAARPLLSRSLVQKVLGGVIKNGTAVPVFPIQETVKWVDQQKIERTLPRENLYVSQTPQGFRYDILQAAYRLPIHAETMTDEAALVELTGCQVHVVEGEKSNLKITDPADLAIAELLLQQSFSYNASYIRNK